jgi:hypothetical protein
MLSILIIDDTPGKIEILKNFIFSNFDEIHESQYSVNSYVID